MGIEIRVEFHNKVLRARAIERLLNSEAFEEAIGLGRDVDIMILEIILLDLDLDSVRKWILEHIHDKLEDWSYRRLRDYAKQENIPRYSRMDKDELITEIQKCNKPTQMLPEF